MRYPKHTVEAKRARTPLAEGYRGLLFGLIGDLDYYDKILGLNKWSTSENFCFHCKATSKGSCTYTDNRPTAPWKATVGTAAEWQASEGMH